MRNIKIQVFLHFLVFGLLFSTCKKIDEDWLTPEWITDKIEILGDDCYYEGSSIKKYLIDTTYYIDVYIPTFLWPEENVYFEDGSQVIDSVSSFSYYNFQDERGTAIESIWEFPTTTSCP